MRVVPTRAPMVLVGSGESSVEPLAVGAAVALDVPVYRTTACAASAVRDDGAQGAFIGGAR